VIVASNDKEIHCTIFLLSKTRSSSM